MPVVTRTVVALPSAGRRVIVTRTPRMPVPVVVAITLPRKVTVAPARTIDGVVRSTRLAEAA